MAGARLDVKYNEELVKQIQEIFIHRIVPANFILVIHKYNRNVLTLEDIERLRNSLRSSATKDVNYDLLLAMKNYKGWFEVILQACNDPDVKQDDLVEAFETIRRELDERWTRDETKNKEIDTGRANVPLTSQSQPGIVNMGRQLSTTGDLKSDSGTVFMSSESGWRGLIWKNEKLYCDICFTPLTSQKAANDHCSGKQHQKKLKEAFPTSRDVSKTDITTAANSQATSNGTKSISSYSEPISGSNEMSGESSGPTSDYQMTSASLKPMSSSDEGNRKEILAEDKSVTTNQSLWGGLKTKNGSLYCDVCDIILTSEKVASDHCKGKLHEKKLNKAFPTTQGVSETAITTVADSPASSGSINVTPTSSERSGSSETLAVSSGQVSICKEITASLTSCKAKKISVSSDSIEVTSASSGATVASSGATVATPASSGATVASSGATVATPASCGATVVSSSSTEGAVASSGAIVATPASCGATVVSSGSTEGAVASPDSTQAISTSDGECIVLNENGTLECRICNVPFTSRDNATEHLLGSKHKKNLEALKAQCDHNATPPELGPHGEIIVVCEDGTGKCFVCNIPINSKESAKQHLQGRKHINQCQKYKLPLNMCI